MRFKRRIDLNELKSAYQPNSYISFNLPRGKVDLHSLTLYYEGNPSNYQHHDNVVAGTAIKTFNSESSSTIKLNTSVTTFKNSIRIPNHGFTTGLQVTYETDGGNALSNLTDSLDYFVIRLTKDLISLASTSANATATPPVPIVLTARGTGANHSLRYPINLTVYKTVRRFFPRLASCIIQELVVKIDNVEKQHLYEYNTLSAILNDIYKEYDDIDGVNYDSLQAQSVDADGYIQNTCKLQAVTRDLTNNSMYFESNKERFFIDKFLGFLGEGDRFIDTTDKDVQIQIKLAPANILYRGVNTIEDNITVSSTFKPDYILSDVYAIVDVVDDATIPNEFGFKDYQWVSGNYLQNNKKFSATFETQKPINWVLGTFLNPNRFDDAELQLMHCSTTDIDKFGFPFQQQIDVNDINNRIPSERVYSYEVAKFQKEPYLLNSSIYFDRQGKAIRHCQFRLNNYDLTPRLDMVACYNETKKCSNSDYKKVVSINSFEENFFANAIRLDDTSNELKSIQWEVDVTNPSLKYITGGYPMLFCCLNETL